MALWVPPRAAREHAEARREYEHELGLVAEKQGLVEEWDKVLSGIDPHLSIFFAPEWANVAGVTPGRYHVLWNAPGVVPTVLPVTGPNGEFVEPGSSMLDLLHRSEMWNATAGRERARKERLLAAAKERASLREREDLREEFRDRAKARFNPGVSFSDTGWKYRASARTEKKAA